MDVVAQQKQVVLYGYLPRLRRELRFTGWPVASINCVGMPNEGAVLGRIIGGIFVDNDQIVGYQGCGSCSYVGFCSFILFKGTE